MNNDKKTSRTTKPRHVSVNSSTEDDIPERDILSPKDVSVHDVREALQNAIDAMGPNPVPANFDPDIDDSYSSSLNTSSANRKQIDDDKSILDSQMTICDVSEITNTPPDNPQTHRSQYMTQNLMDQEIIYPQSHNNEKADTNLDNNHGFKDTCKIIKQTAVDRKSRLVNWLGNKNETIKKEEKDKHGDLYRINIDELIINKDHSPPRRLVFDLVEETLKADTKTIGTNTKNIPFVAKSAGNGGIHTHVLNAGGGKLQKDKSNINMKTYFKGDNATERVDVYYFDHGNSGYYRTTDFPPMIMTEYLAERTEHYTKRFWAQIFGTLHIGVSFVTSFILQFFRFLLQAIIRPLTVGLIQLIADYFIKPFLAVIFNGIVQPPMIFLYNFATSFRDLCEPLATSIGYFIREVSVMCKSIRLVQVDHCKSNKPCS